MKPQKKDYKIIIEADINNEVIWKLFKKGEPAPCDRQELIMAESMITEILDKIKKYGYWNK